MSQTTTLRWSFEEDVFRYQEAGIRAIGIWRQKLSDYGEAKAAELLEETGVKAAHLFWAGGFTGSDGRSFRDALVDAREAIETAVGLGTKVLTVYSGDRGGHIPSHLRRLMRSAFRELAPIAEEHGVMLAIEPMRPDVASGWTYLTSLDETLEVIHQVSSPAVKLIYDVFHFGCDPADIERIPELVDRVALVQMADSVELPEFGRSRSLHGPGHIPLPEIVDAFQESGYQGYYDVELWGPALEPVGYESVVGHIRNCLDMEPPE
ncbi:MAG: sugar phosphate isomerase/epimerase family protein [Planctomycetia bacterium]